MIHSHPNAHEFSLESTITAELYLEFTQRDDLQGVNSTMLNAHRFGLRFEHRIRVYYNARFAATADCVRREPVRVPRTYRCV